MKYFFSFSDHSKALSAYQKYMRMTTSTSKSSKKLDPCLLYGLGLVYFHFNAFLLADRAFHDLLYLYPAFERANEVHLRLGIMAKISGDYDISLKYLNTSLSDVSSPCSFTRYGAKLVKEFVISEYFFIAWKYSIKINMVNIRSPFFVDFFETFYLIKLAFFAFSIMNS